MLFLQCLRESHSYLEADYGGGYDPIQEKASATLVRKWEGPKPFCKQKRRQRKSKAEAQALLLFEITMYPGFAAEPSIIQRLVPARLNNSCSKFLFASKLHQTQVLEGYVFQIMFFFSFFFFV